MTNEIQVGSYNALLAKLLSMKERSPSPILAPEIVPAFVLESDRPEWAFLKGERLVHSGQAIGPTAALFAAVALNNPVGSGLLVVLERLRLSNGEVVVNTIQWRTLGGNLVGTPLPSTVRDTRQTFVADLQVGARVTETAGAQLIGGADGVGVVDLAADGGHFQEELPIILAPGTAFLLENANPNVGFRYGFVWRERTLDPSETR